MFISNIMKTGKVYTVKQFLSDEVLCIHVHKIFFKHKIYHLFTISTKIKLSKIVLLSLYMYLVYNAYELYVSSE